MTDAGGSREGDADAGVGASPTDAVELRFRNLVDHNPGAVCVHEAGRVVYVNVAGVQWMAAQSAEQIVGRPITDFVHPDSVPSMLERIALLSAEGDASLPSEAVLLRLDGKTLDVEAISVLTRWEGRPAYQVVFRDLTAQKAAETTLRYQAALVNHVSDAIIATTGSGLVTSWNPAAESIYGRSAAQTLAGPVSEAVGAPLDPAAIVLGGGVTWATHRAADGSALSVRVSAAAMDRGYVLLSSDQTALRRAEQHFTAVVDSLDKGVVVINPDGTIASANPAARRIFAVSQYPTTHTERALKFPLYDEDGRLLPEDERPVNITLRTGRPIKDGLLGFDRPDGQRVWLRGTTSLLNPDDPKHSAVLLSFLDVTANRVLTQRFRYEATHDPLTGLRNRAYVVARIADALDSTGAGPLSAVVFIDLDNLKAVNDSLGHHAGDAVLRLAGRRLRGALRGDDVLARLGGDEFVALLPHPIADGDLAHLAERLHTCLAQPVNIEGHQLRVSASIGIARIDEPENRSAEEILRDADVAMYNAKINGAGRTCLFEAGLPDRAVPRSYIGLPPETLRDSV